MRMPFEGIGKPESLRENLAGFWSRSRRIYDTNRLVYPSCVTFRVFLIKGLKEKTLFR
ncbi:type II toxin-antitoxin system YoeB family toxin [Nostoc sp.]|uniref:type II toxin-antitoxin system YoeB family toxin n=1 Tax=Nostoc sp. TaxID=1180 RepID=UPI003FA58D5C